MSLYRAMKKVHAAQQEHDDRTCLCGHDRDQHEADGNCAVLGCCPEFESISDAAERQGMRRAADMANG